MSQIETAGYRHEALFYRGDEEFLAGTLPLVREAVDADAAVLVAIPKGRAAVLREALDGHREGVAFADMEELGRNPGRIIAAWRRFVRAHAGGETPPLGIGEPIWPERSEAELVECQRHETLLNLAFSPETPWTLLCPYDARRLPHDVLDAARRNHPHVHERGCSHPSETYARAIPGCEPLPAPTVEPDEVSYAGIEGLAALRELIAARAEREGLGRARVADLVLAVDELATNTLRYARGEGVLRLWREDAALVIEVADAGHIADPLAGRDCPPATELGGRGLYLVNQLCDLVQLRSSPEGSVIRIRMRLG
jgi:anti-sigma regulatory factor (Ser/Thr protein kinase)